MKKILVTIAVCLTLLISSCGIEKHVSFSYSTPSSPNDTISIEAKAWGLVDLIKANTPANSNFAVFMTEADKRCDVIITNVPKTLNDTIGYKLQCDSLTAEAQKFLSKGKK